MALVWRVSGSGSGSGDHAQTTDEPGSFRIDGDAEQSDGFATQLGGVPLEAPVADPESAAVLAAGPVLSVPAQLAPSAQVARPVQNALPGARHSLLGVSTFPFRPPLFFFSRTVS